jgi:hypothetical protein
MRIRSRLVLPACGLALFALVSYWSVREGRRFPTNDRYFRWSGMPLDTDPRAGRSNDPEYVLVEPGLIMKSLVLSALPAFLVGLGIVQGLAHLGVNEVVSFFVSMPPLIVAWFYFVGWLVDRWRTKRFG